MVIQPQAWPEKAAEYKAAKSAKLIQLDALDTTILKGLAISAIVLHNFFHAVSPVAGNEFGFRAGSFALFVDTVRHPLLAVQALFSYFGYLGVPVFIFLSAYGLSKSHWDDSASWTQFMSGRIRKLFPVVAIVVMPWMLGDAVRVGMREFLHTVVPQIALMVTGLSPLVPGQGLPPVGPWWFIPFILEFYAVFFVLRLLTREFGWPGLVVLAFVGMAVTTIVAPHLAHWGINLFETPLGRLPSICLGIAAARYSLRVTGPVVLISGAVLVLGNEYRALWPFTYTAAALLALWAYMELRDNLRASRSLERIGEYSVLIFLLNGIVRDDFLRFATTPLLQLLFGAISAAASFAFAAIIQQVLIRPALSAPIESESVVESAA